MATVTPSETLTLAEGVDVNLPLRVIGATSFSPFQVRLTFSHPLDPGFSPNFDPANYTITPSLSVVSAAAGASTEVFLGTAEQGSVAYTVEVASARSVPGDLLDPASDTAFFVGFPIAPTFFATAQSRTKVQITFASEMTQDAAFTDEANYSITDLQGNSVSIGEIVATGDTPIRRVYITLDDGDLVPGGYYVATVTSAVTTVAGTSVSPSTDVFQWGEMQNAFRGVAPISIPIENFTGEVSGGLLGQPAGQVFFSPSLEEIAPNSSIQVDDVQVCTRAFDEYTIPEIPDPAPLTTFTVAGPSSLIGTDVLYAGFDRPNRMQEVQINLQTYRESETYGGASDGPADATLNEPLEPTRISLLNNPNWETFGGTATDFIVADNLTSIPAGSSSNINLQP